MQIGNRHAGAAFPLTTQFAVPGERDGGQAVAFTTRALPVADMELDLESPIAVGEDETPEDTVRRAVENPVQRAGRLKPAERRTGPARCGASPLLRPHAAQTP